MKVNKTEFGDFTVTQDGEYSDLFLSYEDKSLHLGWVKLPLTVDGDITKERIFDRFIQLFIMIMRAEVKLAMFKQLPLNNSFKDAVLRMQIENTGQTFEVRKFVDDYDKVYSWRDFEAIADLYEIESFRLTNDFVFRCPYGRYSLTSTSPKDFNIVRFREDVDYHLSDIYIPYFKETDDTKKMAAMLQGIDNVSNDINDLLHLKKYEMIKRIAEVIKYIFGYDKLRRAMRNRATA